MHDHPTSIARNPARFSLGLKQTGEQSVGQHRTTKYPRSAPRSTGKRRQSSCRIRRLHRARARCIEGLVHITEMSWTKKHRPSPGEIVLKVGQEARCVFVLEHPDQDEQKHQRSASSQAGERIRGKHGPGHNYPVGATRRAARSSNMTDVRRCSSNSMVRHRRHGAHVSDIVLDRRKINHPSEMLHRKGDDRGRHRPRRRRRRSSASASA